MLFDLDPRVQSLGTIAWLDRNLPLGQDRPTIDIVRDEVHGTTRFAHTCPQRPRRRIHTSGKRGQKRRMKVQDPAGKAADECRRENGIIAGTYDQIDCVELELTGHGDVAGLSVRIVLAKKNGCRYPGAAGMIQTRSRAVRAHNHNPSRIFGFGRGINHRFEVASSAGDEDANAQQGHAEM